VESITQTQKAQGGTEYLVTMSVVLGIALICIALLTWPIGTTKDAKKQQADIHFKINEIGTQVEDENWQTITQGMVGYWKFDEGSGTSTTDSRGGNAGTLTNGPIWTSNSKSGQALDFDGSNDFVSTSFVPTRGSTICGWFLTRASSSQKNIFDLGGSNILMTLNTKLLLQYAGSNYVYSATVLNNNQWYHICAYFSGNASTSKIYLNGKDDTSVPIYYSEVPPSISGFRISSSSNSFNGSIDEVMIFNRALTANEIRLLYENPGYPN